MGDSQQKFNAGATRGHAEAKTDQWIDSTKNAANSACKETANATQHAKESTQHGKEETGQIFQQTGEKVKNMAQGAVDSVKNTLGVSEHSSQ